MKNLILALILSFSSVAQATLIEVVLDKSSFALDENITGEIRVSDANETLGGFWALLNYTPGSLSFVDWQFGTGFDDGFGSMQIVDAIDASGELYIDEYADLFADELTLSAAQAGGFSLGSFTFAASAAGNYSLNFDDNYLGLLNYANDFVDFNFVGVRFVVTDGTPVPVPATLLLMITAIGLLRIKR